MCVCVYIYIYIYVKFHPKNLDLGLAESSRNIFFFLFFFNKDYIFLRRHVRVEGYTNNRKRRKD